jgi:hypothetical protein
VVVVQEAVKVEAKAFGELRMRNGRYADYGVQEVAVTPEP